MSNFLTRLDTFIEDAVHIIDAGTRETSPDFVFSDFVLHLEEHTLEFKWTSLTTKNSCVLNYIASEDYPRNSLLYRKFGTQEPIDCILPLRKLLPVLGKDLHDQERTVMESGEKGPVELTLKQSPVDTDSRRSSDRGDQKQSPVDTDTRRSSDRGDQKQSPVDTDSRRSSDRGDQKQSPVDTDTRRSSDRGDQKQSPVDTDSRRSNDRGDQKQSPVDTDTRRSSDRGDQEEVEAVGDAATKLAADSASPLNTSGAECSEDSDLEFVDCQSGSDWQSDDDEVYDFDPENLFSGEAEKVNEDQEVQDLRRVHPLLRHDIQVFRDLYEPVDGCRSRRQLSDGTCPSTEKMYPFLGVRLLEALEEVDCDIHVPVNTLDLSPQLAHAWGLSLNEHLVVRINLSSKHYLNVPGVPRVDVFQHHKKDNNIGPQLKNIITLFLGEIWPKLTNDFLQSKLKKCGSMPCDLSSAAGAAMSEDGVNLAALEHLQEMGFGEMESRSALLLNSNNLMEASIMLSNMASSDEATNDSSTASQSKTPLPKTKAKKESKDASEKSQKASSSFLRNPCKAPRFSKRHLSTPETFQSKKSESITRSMSMSQTQPNLSEGSENPIVIESSSFLHAKRMPSLEEGFLVMLYRYVLQRVPTVNEFCVVCDRSHVFHASGAMLMPSVCSRELCLFSFQTLGVMADSMADIATGAEVVDLLITFAKAACFSSRKAIIFSPYPNIVDPDHPEPGRLALSDRVKDFRKLETLLTALPPMKTLLSTSCTNLQKTLNAKDKLLYPLLNWIIYSNRSHIVKLPPEKQLHSMATPHQFILLSSPPAQEKSFQEAKEEYGSTFAFHGSRIENWHSIVRHGLIVATGTKFQMNGAFHGKGIYLSPVATLSAHYALMGHGSHRVLPAAVSKPPQTKGQVDLMNRFLQGKNVMCIALCEVIKSDELVKKNADIWLCTNAAHVCTRFFFLYEDEMMNCMHVDMRILRQVEMVEKALADSFMAVVPKLSRHPPQHTTPTHSSSP
ncbi:protein mono-ADP-ribosyltransferase PARP6-like isoform X2 [Babylonia areolata]|uniref:protein mono-ADP-ribosyltransferase PARP6-like isoform X2 n=1 Tax=Babylonia areolata TaxID=304850 RepID=UPI003FD43456